MEHFKEVPDVNRLIISPLYLREGLEFAKNQGYNDILIATNDLGIDGINNGEMPLKQLAPLLYRIFGVEAKDCYRFYIDIKRRKTISHTHFLEQMQERLNERIRRDEEAELKRR